MTEKEMYQELINAGMTPNGACALLGNMMSESALRANNAENGHTYLTDEEYTEQVDNGKYKDFIGDAVGYGLVQWTFWSRKKALKEYADSLGVSIGDTAMQLRFCLKEIQEGYPSLWQALKTESLYDCTSDICLIYERPASNNVENRYANALTIYSKYVGDIKDNGTKLGNEYPVIKYGSRGSAVRTAQQLLKDAGYLRGAIDGDFGNDTKTAVMAFQEDCLLESDGIVGKDTWAMLIGANREEEQEIKKEDSTITEESRDSDNDKLIDEIIDKLNQLKENV